MIALAESTTSSVPSPPGNTREIIGCLQRTVSPSRLSLFLQCRLKFFFRHVAKIQKQKTLALHLGGCVHSVLKAWNKARWRQQPLTLKQLHEEYATAWSENEPSLGDGSDLEERQIGWRLVETYFRQCGIQESEKPDAVEVPVEADLGGHGLPILIGILDLVQRRTIIDFKTSSSTPNPERVAHTHEIQTSCYAVLYREATGQQ